MINKLPKSKLSNFVVQELKDEVLLYNLELNKALSLNPSSAFIWKHCDGKTDLQQLINAFNQEFKININEDFVWLALDELAKAELLEDYTIKFKNRLSRRKVLLNYALPMAMLPVITSLIAPTAAQAASGAVCVATPTASCSVNADCTAANTPCSPGCTCSGFVCTTATNCCSATGESCA